MINTIKSSKLSKKLKTTAQELKKRFSEKLYPLVLINLGLVTAQVAYLLLRYKYINSLVPLWYTKMWGNAQLGEKYLLFLIPISSVLVAVVGLLFTIPFKKYYVRHGFNVITRVTIFTNAVLTYSLIRIIFAASTPFGYLIKPTYVDLFIPAILAFVLASVVLPRFISFAYKKDLITNPQLHLHPGMLLRHPTARGGGFLFGVLFLILSILFVGIPSYLIYFYTALLLLSLLGILDDYQNTHPKSSYAFLENPYVRLVLLFLIVSIVSTLGVKIFSVAVPFSGVLSFNSYIISSVVTTFWIVWVLNVLSWSNGIDGQYAGIVGIASIIIALLALRFDVLETLHRNVAIMAAISAGLCLGFVRYTWHPSKILWGFGAMCAGLVLSVLSILISSKVITSVIIILIPFLDALVTFIRRLLQGKNPLKGDKGHLHHLLLERGWSMHKIALFYWATTALFGIVGLLSADKYTLQVGFTLVGISAFGIVLLNLKAKN